MSQQQVSNSYSNTQDRKIQSAIDMLLSSDSVKVAKPTVQLTQCSPEVDVVMNKQGGICTRCNSMFKSRSALLSHPEKCRGNPNKRIEIDKDNEGNPNKRIDIDKDMGNHWENHWENTDRNDGTVQLTINRSSPQLIIVPQ